MKKITMIMIVLFGIMSFAPALAVTRYCGTCLSEQDHRIVCAGSFQGTGSPTVHSYQVTEKDENGKEIKVTKYCTYRLQYYYHNLKCKRCGKVLAKQGYHVHKEVQHTVSAHNKIVCAY